MFCNKRYITIGIKNTVPIELQYWLWYIIDRRISEGAELDYLQIFELYEIDDGQGIKRQKIVHKQEQPEYEQLYLLTTTDIVSCKIYVIDDETHSTMLLAEEY